MASTQGFSLYIYFSAAVGGRNVSIHSITIYYVCLRASPKKGTGKCKMIKPQSLPSRGGYNPDEEQENGCVNKYAYKGVPSAVTEAYSLGGVSNQCPLSQIQSFSTAAAAAAKSLQSCLTLCDPIDGSPAGSTFHGILQARTLEWAAISVSSV